ncbi:IS110 family transposase [Vibrio sp. PNB23_22_6]
MSIKVVGIDIAKNLFQICVLGTDGRILSNRKVKRDKLLDTIRQLPDRTALANQIRGLAAEYGVVFPLSIKALRSHLPLAIEDAENELSHVMRSLLQILYCDFIIISDEIDEVTQSITRLSQQHPRYESIKNIPGFGPILTAAIISEVGSGKQFQNGRQFSAWCGLVPKQNSSGGKSSLGALSKNGNHDLRTLLVHGARAVVRCRTNSMGSYGCLAQKSGCTSWQSENYSRFGKQARSCGLAYFIN